jgi:hypothetical protein
MAFVARAISKTGTLTGGLDVGEDFPIPVGSFVSSNLTPAGRLKHWPDGEIFRAIRKGVDADGHWLTLMSYTNAGSLSDDDSQAVIAYIRSVPAAGEPTPDPPDQLNLLGVAMLGAGMLPFWPRLRTPRAFWPPRPAGRSGRAPEPSRRDDVLCACVSTRRASMFHPISILPFLSLNSYTFVCTNACERIQVLPTYRVCARV